MSRSAAAPNAVLPSGITEESKWRIEILISRNDDPHVRAMPMERSQSSPEKFAFDSIDLWLFINAHFRQPNKAAALVYWYV
jgi:hypothetical protein